MYDDTTTLLWKVLLFKTCLAVTLDECRSMLNKFVENRKLIECNESTDSDSNEE